MEKKVEIDIATALAAIDCLCSKPLFDEEDEATTRAALDDLNTAVAKFLGKKEAENGQKL